ncbi:hypothetical protein ACVIHH_007978 [Bradyrhizobium sp. USDA 4518]
MHLLVHTTTLVPLLLCQCLGHGFWWCIDKPLKVHDEGPHEVARVIVT